VLWRRVPYSTSTHVGWRDGCQAYTSGSPITGGEQVRVGFSAAIDVGQVLRVLPGGIGLVCSDGHAGAVAILNTTSTMFTCGISGGTDSEPAPYCAFPLYGNHLQTLVPLGKILLMFATREVAPGTVVEHFYDAARTSFGPGVLIDLTGATQRALTYDINTGWSWGGYTWARTIPPGTDLVPLLIERPEAEPVR